MKSGSGRGDLLALVALCFGIAIGVTVWLIGEMAALFSHGRWLAVSPASIGSVMARLPSSLGNPTNAWPASVRSDLPTQRWMYLAAASVSLAVVAGVVFLAVLARRAISRAVGGPGAGSRVARGRAGVTPSPRRSQTGWGGALQHSGLQGRNVGGARWARRRDLAPLVVRRPGQGRLVLGSLGRTLVATEARHSVLVLGPTQSGKTTALAIPALLEWDGPVVATSVKDDLVAQTSAYRAGLGRIWIFDPTGKGRAGSDRSPWSPLVAASTWSGAQRVAQALVGATPAQTGMGDGAFWFAAAAKLLAPMLLAAQRGGHPLSEVVRWTNLQETDEPLVILQLAGEIEASHALLAGLARDDRIRSSIYTTLETVLAPYEDPVVARSAERSDIDPVALLDGRNTLYLCGPAHEQARVQGVFSALVGAVVHAAIERYERDGPLSPPLLIVLDEAANIAPIQDLDRLASTGAGMGIQLVTVCQDLSQLAARYGADRARSIANNHRAKMALSGIADVGTLDTVSGLAGEQAVQQHTITADHSDGRRSTSSSITYRRLAPADELRRIPPGRGVLIYGHLPPVRLTLRPWYSDRELRRRVACAPEGDAGQRLPRRPEPGFGDNPGLGHAQMEDPRPV